MNIVRHTTRFLSRTECARFLTAVVCAATALLSSCAPGDDTSDAYGNFEADDILISAEAGGELVEFSVVEGQTLQAGERVGLVDTTQLALRREQLLAQRQAVSSKAGNVLAQIAVLEEQKRVAVRERERVERLLADSAATRKQYDDIAGNIAVLDRQIRSVETQNAPVVAEVRAIDAQIAQVEDQLRSSAIVNPVAGTVLTRYADAHELTTYGRPLYSIADMQMLTLRAYISGAQLPHIRLGETVKVLIDEDAEKNSELSGTVSWISSKAEFTPRVIQTKEERVNMVYAIKIRVPNDGRLKIGMPGEVRFVNGGKQQ